MTKTTQFMIDSEVRCSDGALWQGQPRDRRPARPRRHPSRGRSGHEDHVGRVVPLDLVDETMAAEIELRCTTAEFAMLEAAEETYFLRDSDRYQGYDSEHVLIWPHYRLGVGGMGMGGMGLGAVSSAQTVTIVNVPPGEVDVRRGEKVFANDGDIGHVQGLVIDTDSHHVTHVLLQEGHLWGRKDVAIPIGAVTKVTDGIQLNLTKQQVQDLPAVDIDQPFREPVGSGTGADELPDRA